MTSVATRNPYQNYARDHCAACGDMLSGSFFALPERPERYCANCIENRPRCDVCSAPLADAHWQLHDRRRLCATCHATAVYDPDQAEQLFRETVGAVVAQLRLDLRFGVAFRLVDAPTMMSIRSQAGAETLAEGHVQGLYQRSGDMRAIYMLYGMPRLLFRTIVAHEYGHAWQNENAPKLDAEHLREGFAEWVAYCHLCYLGCTKAARQMITSQHPYRPFLEQVLEIERSHGPMGVLEHVRRAGDK